MTEQAGVPITDEQPWVEAAREVLWRDVVLPLVARAEDAERRIRAVRDVCADNLGVTTASVLGALDREGTRR